MNSFPISPGLHALLNAASEANSSQSPLPSASSAGSGGGSRSSPLLSSLSTSSHFLSALHLRSPPSSALPSSSSPTSASTLTGMSILKMPPAVGAQSLSPTAASTAANKASAHSPASRESDSPEEREQEQEQEQDGDEADGSLFSPSPPRDAPDSPLSSLASASSHQSTTPSAQLQSAFFSSPTTAPSQSSSLSLSMLHAPQAPSQSPLTSLLQPHSSTLQVRRNSTGGSGLTKLLTQFKRSAKVGASLSAAGSSSLFKKKLTAASSLTASSSADSSDSAGGSSCHQCKSRRNYGDLSYCSSSLNKKNKNAVCRKKYCSHVGLFSTTTRRTPRLSAPQLTSLATHPVALFFGAMWASQCLKKFYRESPITADGQVWKCPSCRKICCCAACRRREMRGGGAGAAGGLLGTPSAGEAAGLDMDGQGAGMDTPPSNALSPVHSFVKHEQQQQQQQDIEMSPVEQSPSPPQSAFRGLLLSPHTPSLPPLPASALSAREAQREQREGKDESIRDIHRTLLTVAHSPALTALSAAASTLNGGSYSAKKESTSGLLDGGSMGGGAGAGRYAGLMTASLSRGLGVSGLNGHSLLNGHGSAQRTGRRRNGFAADGHESSTSSPSSTDDSDDDTADVDIEAESSTVGDKEEEARNGQASEAAADNSLSTFALFYSIGQMSAVQEGVRDVIKRSAGSNAEKLKEIESMLLQVAERVSSEEIPLQL